MNNMNHTEDEKPGMTLTELRDRLTAIIDEHKEKGWDGRNNQEVIIKVQVSKQVSDYYKIQYATSGSYGLSQEDEQVIWFSEIRLAQDPWVRYGGRKAKAKTNILTEYEKAVLKGIYESEYNSNETDCTWTFSAIEWAGLSTKTGRGVVSSLVQKGVVVVDGEFGNNQDESTITTTDLGKRLHKELMIGSK